MLITFIWHLLIALVFIIALYVGATYSALCNDLKEMKALHEKISAIKLDRQLLPDQGARTEVIKKKLDYYTGRYDSVVMRYEKHKRSVYARPLLRFFKKLDQ